MAKKWYWFVFGDGHKVCCMGMSRQEMQAETRKHGTFLYKYEDFGY
jgi:hypothetical protein